jgi:hypothetical protein
MRIIPVLAILPILAACGGGSGSTPLAGAELQDDALYNPDGAVINACSSPYYAELIGTYDGVINYTDIELSCTWETDLQISGRYETDPATRSICDVTYNVTTALDAPVDGCADIGAGGQLVGTLTGRAQWESPPWPVPSIGTTPAELQSGVRYVFGVGGVPVFEIVNDGRGNINFAGNNTAGVLVKQ